MPGTGGRPRQLPGNGTSVGSSAATPDRHNRADPEEQSGEHAAAGRIEDKDAADQENPTRRISGLLYFPLDGKHKMKDLELLYSGPAGRLELDFKR